MVENSRLVSKLDFGSSSVSSFGCSLYFGLSAQKVSYFQCMDAKLNLDQNEIQNLATDINDAIGGVADVEQIITDTAQDIITAQDLKNSAELAQQEAEAELLKAENVSKALSQAEESQNAADLAVTQTRSDIDSARADLGQV